LRSAERHRKAGKEYAKGGDLEAAFVEFAKAATLVLEKLPTHKDYLTVLTAEQRHNLGLVCIALFTYYGESASGCQLFEHGLDPRLHSIHLLTGYINLCSF
jgi:hypothetical protein